MLAALFLLASVAVAPVSAKGKEVRYWSCDDWKWAPFDYAGVERLRKQVAAGETPTYEWDGPIVRKCPGWYPDIGRAVEGVKGTGWRLVPRKPGSAPVRAGYHGWGIFSPEKRYRIEGYAKGKGSFKFVVWYYCLDLKTGANVLHKFMTIYEGALSDTWTKFSFDFTLPDPPAGLKGQNDNPFGIEIPAETDFAVDELRILEV